MYDNVCTAKQKLENNIEFREVDWKSLCQAVYRVTNDTYTRQFQYKIIHNYLPTNSLLFNYKLTDSNRCTFCFIHKETIKHLFCECSYSVTSYKGICQYLEKYDVVMPSLSPTHILYGLLPVTLENKLENHMIILYKLIIFTCRTKSSVPRLPMFQIKLKEVMTIEHKIAIKNGKILHHLQKWKTMNEIL